MENEKRLIDAYALENAIRTDYFEHFTQYHDTDQIALIDMVCDDIEESPTVDAVEVVRCKDCKHWLKDFAGCSDIVGRCEWANYAVGANGYCLYGEPKGDANHG